MKGKNNLMQDHVRKIYQIRGNNNLILKNCVHGMRKSKLPYPFLGTNIFKLKFQTFDSSE